MKEETLKLVIKDLPQPTLIMKNEEQAIFTNQSAIEICEKRVDSLSEDSDSEDSTAP